MTPHNYIQSKLNELGETSRVEAPSNADELVELLFKLLMSKKFRKYSVSPEYGEHIKKVIRLNVEAGQPINVTFFHGAYKLWRLEEAPEVDWAELFTLMYYSNWVKSVCGVYEPGVWFDFFVDDYIVPRIDNVDMADVEAYLTSYQRVMDFLKPYQPDNLKMTYTTVGSLFPSKQAFDQSLERNLEKLIAETDGKLEPLSEAERATVELNAKPTKTQLKDPLWREKVYRIYRAYRSTKAEPGYHKDRPDKIMAFTQPLASGGTISVGSTKDSVAKFWVAVGALKPKEGSYRQIILSPAQLAKAEFTFKDVGIRGLEGKNFDRIRILS